MAAVETKERTSSVDGLVPVLWARDVLLEMMVATDVAMLSHSWTTMCQLTRDNDTSPDDLGPTACEGEPRTRTIATAMSCTEEE